MSTLEEVTWNLDDLLEDGTESDPEAAVVALLDEADKAAGKNLAPARDSADRYKLLEWLNFITTELHKNFGPMFSPVLADDLVASAGKLEASAADVQRLLVRCGLVSC